MKKITKPSYLSFALFCLSLAISTCSNADHLTIACPDPSMLVKVKGNIWKASIPATNTRDGHPVATIILTGQVDEKYKDNDKITFHMNTGLGYGIINNERTFFYCYYDTQYSGNYQSGNGIEISLTGQTDLFKYFHVSDCKINSMNYEVNCTNP